MRRRSLGRRLFMTGSGRLGIALSILLLIVMLSGLILPLNPATIDLLHAWEAPSLSHPCGRDGLGRDVLARVLVGTETTLGIATLALLLVMILSGTLGALAGSCGPWIDIVIIRVVDLLMGFRELVLAMVIVVLIGPGSAALIIILGLGCSPGLIRLVRTLVLAQLHQEYALASVALGATRLHTLRNHILPNIVGPVAVKCAAIIGPLIQSEAALSFLGVGVQDPFPSLGTLIRDGLSGLRDGPHLILSATIAVFLLSLAATLLADGLRDALDPR